MWKHGKTLYFAFFPWSKNNKGYNQCRALGFARGCAKRAWKSESPILFLDTPFIQNRKRCNEDKRVTIPYRKFKQASFLWLAKFFVYPSNFNFTSHLTVIRICRPFYSLAAIFLGGGTLPQNSYKLIPGHLLKRRTSAVNDTQTKREPVTCIIMV